MSGFVQDYAFWNWQFLSCKSIHSQSFSASCTAWPDPDCTAMECRTMRGWCRRRGMIRDGRSKAGQVWVVGLVWGLSLYYDCLHHFLHWFVMALQGMMKSWLIVSHCCGLRTHRNQNEAKMKAAASLFKQTNNFPTKQLPQIHANIQGAVKQACRFVLALYNQKTHRLGAWCSPKPTTISFKFELLGARWDAASRGCYQKRAGEAESQGSKVWMFGLAGM